MLHIFKRIQGRQRPQEGHQAGKNASHAVDPEHDGQIRKKAEQDKPLAPGSRYQEDTGNDQAV